MTLTTDDKQWIKTAITEGVVEALDTIVLPRFDEIDRRFERVDERLDTLETEVSKINIRLTDIESRLYAVEAQLRQVNERLDVVEGEIQALTNDIKEIYNTMYGTNSPLFFTKRFAALSHEEKLMVFHKELHDIAKAAGVKLSPMK